MLVCEVTRIDTVAWRCTSVDGNNVKINQVNTFPELGTSLQEVIVNRKFEAGFTMLRKVWSQ